MATHSLVLYTTGFADATYGNAAAANILADSEIATVSIIWNVPEVNFVGWNIISESTYGGDENDFLMYVTHLLLVEGYLMTSFYVD